MLFDHAIYFAKPQGDRNYYPPYTVGESLRNACAETNFRSTSAGYQADSHEGLMLVQFFQGVVLARICRKEPPLMPGTKVCSKSLDPDKQPSARRDSTMRLEPGKVYVVENVFFESLGLGAGDPYRREFWTASLEGVRHEGDRYALFELDCLKVIPE